MHVKTKRTNNVNYSSLFYAIPYFVRLHNPLRPLKQACINDATGKYMFFYVQVSAYESSKQDRHQTYTNKQHRLAHSHGF